MQRRAAVALAMLLKSSSDESAAAALAMLGEAQLLSLMRSEEEAMREPAIMCARAMGLHVPHSEQPPQKSSDVQAHKITTVTT